MKQEPSEYSSANAARLVPKAEDKPADILLTIFFLVESISEAKTWGEVKKIIKKMSERNINSIFRRLTS